MESVQLLVERLLGLTLLLYLSELVLKKERPAQVHGAVGRTRPRPRALARNAALQALHRLWRGQRWLLPEGRGLLRGRVRPTAPCTCAGRSFFRTSSDRYSSSVRPRRRSTSSPSQRTTSSARTCVRTILDTNCSDRLTSEEHHPASSPLAHLLRLHSAASRQKAAMSLKARG